MAMLITIGQSILAEKRAQALPLACKGVYDLDFDKCGDVFKRISSQEDTIAAQFKEGVQGKYLQERYNAILQTNALFQRFAGDMPEGSLGALMMKTNKEIIFRIEVQFECFKCMGLQGDPFTIKQTVDTILGISPSSISLKIRERYFTILTESGFLKTRIKTVSSFTYHPGLAAKAMLKQDPTITTMILGCGRNINYTPSCGFKAHDNALFVDRNSHIAPDVVTNMHKKKFWQKLPDSRLQSILDHTNGQFVFEKAHTIAQIYRVLKSGGKFALAYALNSFATPAEIETRKKIMQSAGFVVHAEEQRVFVK